MNKVVYRHRSGGVFKNIVNFVAEQIQSIMRFRIKFKECMIKGIHIFDKNSSPVNYVGATLAMNCCKSGRLTLRQKRLKWYCEPDIFQSPPL